MLTGGCCLRLTWNYGRKAAIRSAVTCTRRESVNQYEIKRIHESSSWLRHEIMIIHETVSLIREFASIISQGENVAGTVNESWKKLTKFTQLDAEYSNPVCFDLRGYGMPTRFAVYPPTPPHFSRPLPLLHTFLNRCSHWQPSCLRLRQIWIRKS